MPKFPGVLLNNNPNAPSLDLNDLQVKGVGIFADVAERDALDVNIQTEGYLSVMKNDDNVYIYKGGGWTTPANWEKISGTIGFTDSDGNPLGEVSTLVFPEGSISIVGSSGVVAFTAGGTSTDTTNFNGVLSSADTTVQAALDTLDGLSLTLEGLGDTPSGYGTAGQVLITNGVDGFTFGSGSPWDEVAGTTTDILYEEGRVGIRDLTSWNAAQSGYISSGNNLGAGFPGANTQAHIHGKLGISVTRTDNNTYDEALRIVNDRHSSTTGIGIGTYDYGAQIRLYSSFSFTNSIGSLRLNVGGLSGMTTELGGVTIGLGGIDLPGNHYSGAQNYKLRMAGVIQFKNHNSVEWDAIHQGPGTYSNAGVVIGTPRSGDVLYVRNSDVNTVGSFGYVGVNANSPSATGPAFEVSSSYAKFNNGLHIGDITTTGYAFPTATGTTGQILQVDANGDLGFVTFQGSPWEEVAYTNETAIKYESGVVGLKDSAVTYPTSGNLATYYSSTFPIDNGGGGHLAGDALMHLHQGSIVITGTNTSSTELVGIRFAGDGHWIADQGQISFLGSKVRVTGSTGAYLGTTGNPGLLAGSAASSGAVTVGAQVFLPGGGLGTNVDIKMAGKIIFYGHTANQWDAINRYDQSPNATRNNNGVVIASPHAGYFVTIRDSQNVAGSFGYLGINANSPSATGPAFEVSSSYAKFNNGLHVGDITTTGYAFPTATGTTGQVLKVDANGDLVFGDDEAGLWTEDTNGITYTAGNVGIGAASSSSHALRVQGDAQIFTGSGIASSVRIGSGFGGGNTSQSVYMGYNVGSGTGQANANVVIGTNAAGGTGAYFESVIIGHSALAANTAGTRTSVLIGYAAGANGGNGNSAVGVGFRALMNATGTSNVGIGQRGGMMAGGNSTFVGNMAGGSSAAATGVNNVGVGSSALQYVEGDNNTAVGASSAGNLTTGGGNVFLGKGSGVGFTNESNNTVVGYGSGGNGVGNVVLGGLNGVKGNTNVIVGYQTDLNASGATVSGFHTIVGSLIRLSGTSNFTSTTIIGKDAAKDGSVVRSVIIGESASQGGSSTDSTIIGMHAALNGGSRTNSTIIGYKAAVNSYDSGTGSSASATTIVGTYAGYHSKGTENVYIGRSAALCYDQNTGTIQTGSNNVAIGSEAGYHLTTSSNNVLVGRSSGYNLTTGGTNVFLGQSAGNGVITGGNSVAIGYAAGMAHDSGSTVVIGYNAGGSASSTGDEQTIIGNNAGTGNISGANVIIGSNSGTQTMGYGGVVIGRQAHDMASGGSSGQNNILIGKRVMYNQSYALGSGNIIIGENGNLYGGSNNNIYIRGNQHASYINIGGSVSTSPGIAIGGTTDGGHAISMGESSKANSWGISMGWSSGREQTTGTANIYIGRETGRYTTTGAGNVAIGYQAGTLNSTGSNSVFLGYQAGYNETGSNKLYIANSNTTTPLIYGEFDNSILNVNGHLGVNIASDVSYPLTVGGGAKLGGKLAMYSDAAQTAGNVLISYGNFNVVASVGTSSVLIGGIINSTSSNSILIGYNITGSGQDFVISSSTYHSRCVIASSPSNVSNSSVAIYKASAVGAYSVAIGQSSRTDGNGGIAIGLQAKDGNGGVGIGNRAGTGNTNTDTGNVNIGTNAGHRYYNPGGQSFNNTVNVGHEAGRSMAYTTTITGNSVNVGYQAGYFAEGGNNVMVGYRAGYGVDATSLGSGNVFLGYQAGYSETGSDKLYIANSNTTTPLIYGEFDNYHVKINGTYAGSAIGFWPGNNNTNNHISIGDQDYMGIGAGTSVAGFQMLFDSTITNVDYASGLWIGKKWNVGILKNDVLIIGNRITGTATSGNTNPKIVIGNGVSWGATTNNANGILIGASITGNIGGGVVIGGTGNNFNGVSILSQGNEGSQGGTAILGECRGYSVTIGAAAGRAGVGSSGAGQKVYVGINAGKNSSATTAIGASAGQSVNGSYVTAIGSYAFGDAVATASANTAVGDSAGRATTGGSNTFIGARAAISNTTGNSNTAIGGGLGAGSSPALAANITGSRNISIGVNSLETATAASDNIALGHDSGKRAGGSKNIFLGYRTAYLGTNNDTNIANNVVIGHQAGYNTAGSNNVFVGEGAGFNAAGTGNVMLGTRAGYSETGSNRLYISSGQGTDLVYGEFDNDFLKVNGDLEVTGSDGLILNSPNGTRYKVTVSDAGVLSTSLA